MGSLLETIQSPADLKRLNDAQRTELAEEIREFLIQTLAKTGGHLGPNLGVVELTMALHTVFNTPQDKILFDVSHQAYVHKILTGRRSRFDTIRQPGGACLAALGPAAGLESVCPAADRSTRSGG